MPRRALVVAAALGLPVAWYALDRAGAPARALRVLDMGPRVSSATVSAAPSVVAYNIAHGRGAGPDNFTGEDLAARDARLVRISEHLRGHDVVVLNEVDFDSTWSHRVDQAESLARLAGYRYVAEQRNFDFAFPLYSYRFGNAILSQRPLEGCRVLEYPARSALEARLLGHKRGLVCETDLRGHRARVVAVHLEHRDEPTRLRAAQFLLQEIGAPPRDVILAGDFNSAPPGVPGAQPTASGETAVGWLLARGFTTTPFGALGRGTPLSFSTSAPRKRIDWVLVPSDWRVAHEDVRLWSQSDHGAVYVGLTP